MNNDQPLHNNNVIAVVQPLSTISSNAILHFYLHLAQSGLLKVTWLQEIVLCERVLLMLKHPSHIQQKWLFHFNISLQNYEKQLLALSCLSFSLSICLSA